MALPETISARYSEEDAEYLTVRPVRRQTFRFDELIDMVLSVTGKDAERVRQILRSGTIVFHFYRYWWPSLNVPAVELASVLARYPDPNPARPFRPEECTAVLLESPGQPPRHSVELDRATGGGRRLFRKRSAWDVLLDLGRSNPPEYAGYSYSRRADLFRLAIAPERSAAFLAEAVRFAPRALRATLARIPQVARIIFLCPRPR